ncbi:MAG: diaminopimelate decarboxylase [Bacteroidales bacterium]|jgi:diaminopimelate decarboxylase|nr:diaminopimelate decarboxylase [Bacteroidales bacterium]
MTTVFPADKFKSLRTPFYYYDIGLLNETLNAICSETEKYANCHIHYAVKANANQRILSIIAKRGLGADCVSGGEILAAVKAGFPSEKIVFAGVGKADWEIRTALDNNIFCFNVESVPELEAINIQAAQKGKVAPVALRINPEVDAHTHQHITTGKKENKFGINIDQLSDVLNVLKNQPSVKLTGIHFHIGSQITDMTPFQHLCERAAEIVQFIEKEGIFLENINFGGGLGIDYEHPENQLIPNFGEYFETFFRHFPARHGQQLHFEPGRSVVGQCGSLISNVLYVKEGSFKKFVILDAGFTELIRPALYDAYHKIENLTSALSPEEYDVVGPICESSDCFAIDLKMNKTRRNDLIALRSAGAYGEIMASQYNCRPLPDAFFSDEL